MTIETQNGSALVNYDNVCCIVVEEDTLLKAYVTPEMSVSLARYNSTELVVKALNFIRDAISSGSKSISLKDVEFE